MEKSEKKDNKPDFPKMEEEVLKFWEKQDIFKKTLDKTKGGQSFVFFEGPPTANGKPGIHHVLSRAYKDVIPRYKTMRGFYVERKAGWDTHGLPVELQVEKELKISGKPEIEKYGITKFNQRCKESVWQYKKEWEEMTRRVGFWLDLEHPYITYENDYIESLWWIIKQVWDRGLLEEATRVTPYCWRCGTGLSSHEVAQGYKTIKDESIYLKFKLKGNDNTYFLVWTTTPWTLPSNVALAVRADIDYIKVKVDKEFYILAKSRQYIFGHKAVRKVKSGIAYGDGAVTYWPEAGEAPSFKNIKYEIVERFKGKDLVGREYEPLYDFYQKQQEFDFYQLQDTLVKRVGKISREGLPKGNFHVLSANFVSDIEGTGIVHISPAHGEDDFSLLQKKDSQLFAGSSVDEQGIMRNGAPGQGQLFTTADQEIIEDLKTRSLLLSTEIIEHEYPFCWRCDSKLIYLARSSWFIKMSQLKEQLIKNNKDINWVPSYIKHGRFGEWLNEVKDWAFSRERYWGTPLPIWESEDGDRICVGSIEELKELAKDKDKVENVDLHRPFVDDIILVKGGKEYKRIKEVADVWFDSGAMPFAQWHYPFKNKERIDKGKSFPAHFIAEAVDQTRGWFYTLLAVSTLLGKGAPYKNVICLGLILDGKGQKMSKSRGNIVDPFMIMKKYGADTLRWHFFTMNQPGETKLFDEKQLEDAKRKNWMILWNVLSFWQMYAKDYQPKVLESKQILDRWIVVRLNRLIKKVTENLDAYAVTEAGREISGFINELSTWYLRRSRARFKKEGEDKDSALKTLHYVLLTLSKLLAPFVPFLAESLFKEVAVKNKGEVSVHLTDWPVADERLIKKDVIDEMNTVRQAVELAHALRKESQIRVRQPLAQFIIKHAPLNNELTVLIKEEVNVLEVIYTEKLPSGSEFVNKESNSLKVALDTTITDELKHQGIIREMIRHINAMRKDAGLTINDTITLYCEIADKSQEGILMHYKQKILKDVLASDCLKGLPDNVDLKKVLQIDDNKVIFGIKKK